MLEGPTETDVRHARLIVYLPISVSLIQYTISTSSSAVAQHLTLPSRPLQAVSSPFPALTIVVHYVWVVCCRALSIDFVGGGSIRNVSFMQSTTSASPSSALRGACSNHLAAHGIGVSRSLGSSPLTAPILVRLRRSRRLPRGRNSTVAHKNVRQAFSATRKSALAFATSNHRNPARKLILRHWSLMSN